MAPPQPALPQYFGASGPYTKYLKSGVSQNQLQASQYSNRFFEHQQNSMQ